MASLFRARRSEEARSGGKMLRGRKATLSASPYARPSKSSPAAAQSGSPTWLSGLVLGAGKLISSVLPSNRSSQSPSSSSVYSTDDDASSDGYEDMEVLCPLNQGGNVLGLDSNCTDEQLAVFAKSEAKLVIEELLMQESFSRDECDKLTKLIQSRVVDFPSPKVCGNGTEEFRSGTPGDNTLSGPLLPFSQGRTLPSRVPYSSSKTDALCPKPSIFEACTPDICNKAVLEAKKWLEEKKLAQKYDSECGPCTLNTDMLQYGFEGEAGSPVDMAKSYMKSLPPWISPSLSGIGYRSPPSSATCCYRDRASYETADSLLHSSKGLKSDLLFFGSWDTLDETRQVRLMPANDKLEIDMSKQIESSAGASKHENSKSSAEADKRELSCNDTCIDGTFRVPDGNDANANHILETGNINSINIVPDHEETHSNHGISLQNSHLLKTLEEKQPSQTMEEVDNVSVPHDTLASASQLVEHDGNSSSSIKLRPIGNIKSAVPSDAVDVNLNDVPTSGIQTSTGLEETVLPDSFLQLNHVPSVAAIDSMSDPMPQDGNSHVPNSANGSINGISADSSSAGVNANHNHEILSKWIDTTMPQNGTRMKSIERMLTERRVATTRRGRKVVVKSRRGRKS